MKLSTQAILTAGLLLSGSAGVLLPVQAEIRELSAGVGQLESQTILSDSVTMQLSVVRQQIEEFQRELADRDFRLCPDTPESRNAFESDLLKEIQQAGLVRVSMDRKAGTPIAGLTCFLVALVVEGGALELRQFLLGLESLAWVTRVLKLEVQQGDLTKTGDRRRITLQIGVPLEKPS